MKYKYYLRGFGIGVIFATIMMLTALAVHNNLASNNKVNTNSSGNIINTEKDTETEKKTTEKATTTQLMTTTENETTTENQTTTALVTPVETPTKSEDITTEKVTTTQEGITTQETTEPITNVNADEETVVLNVTSGMTSNEAAALLESYGVVSNGYDFNMYLYNNGFESKLRVGTYSIKKNATYQEIAQIITR